MISKNESNYMSVIFNIAQHGYNDLNKRTGILTKRLSNVIFQLDCNDLLKAPLLKSRKVFWKSAIEELFWIFRDGSNDIHDLNPHIWDDWADENGIVQKTYGYQIKKFDQVNRVLNTLKSDPSSRRCVIDLWNNADLEDMVITPCVYTSTWDIVGNQLNCLVTSRSCDILVGGVFNIFQYYILNNLFARHLGCKPGIMTFCIADCHIYVNQIESADELCTNYTLLNTVGQFRTNLIGKLSNDYKINDITDFSTIDERIKDKFYENYNMDNFMNYLEERANASSNDNEVNNVLDIFRKVNSRLESLLFDKPGLDIIKIYESVPVVKIANKDNFFDYKIDDITVEDYYPVSNIKFEVAV